MQIAKPLAMFTVREDLVGISMNHTMPLGILRLTRHFIREECRDDGLALRPPKLHDHLRHPKRHHVIQEAIPIKIAKLSQLLFAISTHHFFRVQTVNPDTSSSVARISVPKINPDNKVAKKPTAP